MYSVSSAYLEAAKSRVQSHNLTGTIGSISFSKENIITGTFHITNQCTDDEDVRLGAVYVGQLECTFTGINIEYNSWIGKVITANFGIKLANNTWETIPLGVYTIIEARHTAEGVTVTAYDNMYKFDKPFKKGRFQFFGGLQSFIERACADCHVTFGMTDEEVEALPNGEEVFEIFGLWGKFKDFANDIETYRDLIFWIAQTLGCFATINRAGQLVFRRYTNTIVDTVSENYRLVGAEFADYITNYTGINVTNMEDNTVSYYGYDATLLQAEITLVQTEIATNTARLSEIESELVANATAQAENQRKYERGEITEEQYLENKARLDQERIALDSEKSSLTRENKQLNKRLNWLFKALEKAQNEEEGTTMNLGSNPFLQSDVFTSRERDRRRVLGALDMISYTPFTCSSVTGAHYDLGDVIYFTGGHAGSDGCFCCLMSYDYTYNTEYSMNGFGVDPIIANMRTKDQKATSAANSNALAGGGSGGYIVAAKNPAKIVAYTGVN